MLRIVCRAVCVRRVLVWCQMSTSAVPNSTVVTSMLTARTRLAPTPARVTSVTPATAATASVRLAIVSIYMGGEGGGESLPRASPWLTALKHSRE